MNRRTAAVSFAVGVAGGYLAARALEKDILSPEQTLRRVKSTVKKHFDIDGAWIYLQPESINQNDLEYQAYKGGLTVKSEDGELVHYDFTADATSGTLISFDVQ